MRIKLHSVRAVNKKALLHSQQGFFVADMEVEISNNDLISDMAGVIKLQEVLPK